jgi:putative ABC transport system substrate-binding protein
MVIKALAIVAFLFLASAPRHAQAQHERNTPRLGYLMDRSGPGLFDQAFVEGLREHGYVVGQNIVMEYRWTNGRSELLPELAAELVAAKVDVIVVAGAASVTAAKVATRDIPIVIVVGPHRLASALATKTSDA